MPAKPTVTFRESDRRPGFRARHLANQVKGTRNQNVRRASFNELVAHLGRRHKQKMPVTPATPRAPGDHRPLTRKAKHLLGRLKTARTWPVVSRILRELKPEIERGRRLRERKPARSARSAGSRIRTRVQRAHDPHLARAERKQSAREAGPARAPVRERLAAREPMRVKAVMVPRDTAPREPARTTRTRT